MSINTAIRAACGALALTLAFASFGVASAEEAVAPPDATVDQLPQGPKCPTR